MSSNNPQRLKVERSIFISLGGLLVAFLVIPILSLFTHETSTLWSGLTHPLVGPALRLSLLTTLVSLMVVVFLGTPLAWYLAKTHGWASRMIETIVQLPIVIPPAVAGIALLLAFGRRGLLSKWLHFEEWSIPFSTTAVVMAEIFVSAPFFIQAATSAFRRIDPQLVIVARTFGATPFRVFFSLALPIASPGLLAGAAMSWARSLGEFGATLMFAGNLQGQTQTLPLAIYTVLESDIHAAQALSIILVIVAFALLLFVRAVLRSASQD